MIGKLLPSPGTPRILMFATLVNTFGDGAYLTTSALFLTRSPYEHHSYRVPDLSDDTVYPSGVYPADAAWSGDGSTVAVGRSQTGSFDPDVLFYAKGSTTPTYVADFRDGDVLWPHSFGTGHAPNRSPTSA